MATESMRDYVLDKVQRRIEGYRNENELINSEYRREKELGRSYKGREILELIQNAEDELSEKLPREISISFDGSLLSVSNYGDPFTKDGVSALMYSNSSEKAQRKKKVIGNKGTGFRSILGWADEITIHSADLHVRFSEQYAQHILREHVFAGVKPDKHFKSATLTFPQWVDENFEDSFTTVIGLKVKNDERVIADIKEQLTSLSDNLLLFLNRTEKLSVILDGQITCFEKDYVDSERVLLRTTINGVQTACKEWLLNKLEGVIGDEHYSIIVAYDGTSDIPSTPYIHAYFQTDVEFPFPVLLHADFNLNGDRNHLTKNDPNNEIILQEAARLLVDTAIKVYSQHVSYDRIAFLIPQKELSLELKKYHFDEMLKQRIAESEIFPTVDQKYVKYSDELIYYKSGLGKYLTGKEFSGMLMFSENERIQEFLEDYTFDRYQYETIVTKISRWIRNRAASEENIRKAAYTAIAFRDEYSWQVVHSDKPKPCFFYNIDRILIPSGKFIFLSDTDTQLSRLPAFLNIEFLDLYMHQYLSKRLGNDGHTNNEVIIEKLGGYNMREFNTRELVEYFNETLKNRKKRDLKERWKTLIRWLWNNKTIFEQDKQTYDLLFLTRSGKFANSFSLYYGLEYGNILGEEIMSSFSEDLMVCDLRDIVNESSYDTLIDFLKMFGVAGLPRRKTSLLQSNKFSRKKDDYENKVFSYIKFPLVLDNDEFVDIGDFLSRVTYSRIEHTDYEHLEDILKSCSTSTILKWILSDNQLQNVLYNRFEQSVMTVEVLWDSRRNTKPLKAIRQPYSYVYFTFCRIPWIQVGDQRYGIDDCLIGLDDKKAILSPHLVEPDFPSYAADFDGPKGKIRRELQTVMERLSIKKSFADLPVTKLYGVLNRLPEIEGAEEFAKRFYNSIVDKTENDYTEEDYTNETYLEFVNNGKILTNNGFQPVSISYYLDGKDVCEKVARTYNLICIPKKRSKARIKKLLGVDQLKLNGQISGIPSVNSCNDEFVANLQQFIVVAFTYRIGIVADLKEEARKFSNIRITLCDTIRATYRTDKDSESRQVELEDYEYILDGTCDYYLKVPSYFDYNHMFHNSELSYAVASIFSSYLDVSDIVSRFTHLYYVGEYDERILTIQQELDDPAILQRSKELLNFNDDLRDEFVGIIEKLSGREAESFVEYIDAIDFEDFNSFANARPMIDLFMNVGIDIEDYNNEVPSRPIDLRSFFQKEIERKLPNYREKYKNTWYQRLRGSSIDEKCKLVENFMLFDSFEVRVENTVNFDADVAIVKQLDIDIHVDDANLAALYEHNLLEWKVYVVNQDYIDEFVKSAEIMSLLYYSEYDLLSQRYKAFLSSIEPKENLMDVSDDAIKEIVPYRIKVDTTPWVPKKRTYSNRKTTGYSARRDNKALEEIGCQGEEIVYKFLLNDKNAKLVTWVSENAKTKNINPEGRADYGYDIEYVDAEDQRKYIDVKTMKKDRNGEVIFYLSEYEYNFGRKHSRDYLIYFVSDIGSDHPRIIVFDNLFTNGSINQKRFSVEISKDYTITAKVVI